MKKLDINISKAQLKSYTVELAEGKPCVSATIELLTEGGKSITSYTVSTNAWQDKDKFNLPTEAIMPIVSLAEILEGIVVRHCRDSQLGLAAASSKPIDLTEVPF